MLMNTLRAIGRFFSLGLFRLALVLIVPLLILLATIGTPSFIKQTIDGSGLYDVIVPTVLEESKMQGDATGEQGQDIIADEDIRNIITDSITPEIIQNNFEGAVDGIYTWLSGETEKPNITFDLTEAKTNLENNLNQYITDKLTALPVCTINDIPQAITADNVLDVSCVPPGVDVASQSEIFTSAFLDKAEFLDELVFTEEDLPKDANGKPFWEGSFSNAPQAYQGLRVAIWIVSGVAVVSGLLLVLLHDKKRAGVRALSWTFLSAGILWGVGALSIWLLLNQVNSSPQIADDAMRDASNAALNIVLSKIVLISGVFGGISTAVGIIGLIFTRSPKQEVSAAEPNTETGTTEHISGTAAEQPEQPSEETPGDNTLSNEGKDQSQ